MPARRALPMKGDMHTETAKFLRREAAGWQAERTRGGHLRLRHPDAGWPVILAATPSDRRGLRNTLSEMRRALRAGSVRP